MEATGETAEARTIHENPIFKPSHEVFLEELGVHVERFISSLATTMTKDEFTAGFVTFMVACDLFGRCVVPTKVMSNVLSNLETLRGKLLKNHGEGGECMAMELRLRKLEKAFKLQAQMQLAQAEQAVAAISEEFEKRARRTTEGV